MEDVSILKTRSRWRSSTIRLTNGKAAAFLFCHNLEDYFLKRLWALTVHN